MKHGLRHYLVALPLAIVLLITSVVSASANDLANLTPEEVVAGFLEAAALPGGFRVGQKYLVDDPYFIRRIRDTVEAIRQRPGIWSEVRQLERAADGNSLVYSLYFPEAMSLFDLRLDQTAAGWRVSGFSEKPIIEALHSTIRLSFRLDPRRPEMLGDVEIRGRALVSGLTRIRFSLWSTLAISDLELISASGQRSTSFTQDTDYSWGHVHLSQPLASGEEFTLRVRYAGPMRYRDRYTPRVWNDLNQNGAYVAYYEIMRAAETDLYVEVPAGWQVAAGGELVGTTDGEKPIYHFRQDQRDARGGLVAVNRYQTLTSQSGGIDYTWYMFPGYVGQREEPIGFVAGIVDYYESLLGPYHTNRLVIADLPKPHGGGVAYPGSIFAVQELTPKVSHATSWPVLIAHEIAHQWFGAAGVKHETSPFVSEAFASYLSELWARDHLGQELFLERMTDHYRQYRAAVGRNEQSIIGAGNRWSYRYHPNIVYDKGAYVLRMLHYLLGEEQFLAAVRQFYQEYAGRPATPWDFARVVSQTSGQDLLWFFDQWLDSTKSLDYRVQDLRNHIYGQKFQTTFTIINGGDAWMPYLDIRVETEEGSFDQRVDLAGTATTVTLNTDSIVRRVILDPERWLLDRSWKNNVVAPPVIDFTSPTILALLVALVVILAAVAIRQQLLLGRLTARRRRLTDLMRVDNFGLDDQGLHRDQEREAGPGEAPAPPVIPEAEQIDLTRPELWSEEIQTILATDVGSTTTKAVLFRRSGHQFVLAARTEAPTTVESPWEDVTIGLRHAIEKMERATGLSILRDGRVVSPPADGCGVDLFISTSSAGGGLQMVVAGVMGVISGKSAHAAAAGAGAIVTDVISLDDGRLVIDRVKRLRELRPDIILMSGGIDGGDVSHQVNLAELIRIAEPRPRLGADLTPVIFAGNSWARPHVARLLADKQRLHIVENIRPVLETENLEPAREMVHKLFMEHVMSQAPGYDQLLEWANNALMPTPGAVGRAVEAFAAKYGINVVAVDIGGATTDVFSASENVFHRTVSANLGMSYSAANVLHEAGVENILRWIPFELSAEDLSDWTCNKMIRPTGLPQTPEDLAIEQALAREAIRLAVSHHRQNVTELHGVQRKRNMTDLLNQTGARELLRLPELDAIIGSGGVLSHAPQRSQALLMLMDAMAPEGVTEIFVDSIFMSPQLGLLSTINPETAADLFEREGLILLATTIAPAGEYRRAGETLARVTVYRQSGETEKHRVMAGGIQTVSLRPGELARVLVVPGKRFDCGAGRGRPVEGWVEGGLFGLVLDGRGRPIRFAPGVQRLRQLKEWQQALQPVSGWSDAAAGGDE
ncbi:MAG: glutamate mutase L [Bacillota bacterium]